MRHSRHGPAHPIEGSLPSRRRNKAIAPYSPAAPLFAPVTLHLRLRGDDNGESRKTCSVVKLGSDLPLNAGGVVVLNPQLRAILLHEFFDHLAALRGLLLVGVEGRYLLERDLFWIVIEIAGQQDAPRLGKLEIQGLVPGRMSRRGLDDHGAIAKHIMILVVQQNRLAVGEALEKFRIWYAACCRWWDRPRGEDRVPVALLHDPGGTGEQAGVSDVIAMVVGERHISDVGRGVADCGELRKQRAIDREVIELLG